MCRQGLLIVTAQTTSPWLNVLIWRAWRGMPGPISASGGKGTGCICPSALTWNEYALTVTTHDTLTISSKKQAPLTLRPNGAIQIYYYYYYYYHYWRVQNMMPRSKPEICRSHMHFMTYISETGAVMYMYYASWQYSFMHFHRYFQATLKNSPI